MKNQYDEDKYDHFFQQMNHSISWQESRKQELLTKIKADMSRKHYPRGQKPRIAYVLSIAVFAICLFLGGAVFWERVIDPFSHSANNGTGNGKMTEKEFVHWDENEMEKLAMTWGNSLKARDGKPRFDIMSARAKEKFIQEQINTSGEEWNYTIGVSSPWVVEFEIEVEKRTATITYLTQTSEPAFYEMQEVITFIYEDGQLVVDDYYVALEDRLIEE